MRILCLDDEPLALKMLEAAIREAKPGADVTAFRKQADLLGDAERNGCDAAFLDIHMRGMNGVELAKKLKEISPKINIIFVTGFSEYKGDAMDMKASGYIMKPVTAEEVKAELDDLRFPIVPKKTRSCACSASETSTFSLRTARTSVLSAASQRRCSPISFTSREAPALRARSLPRSLRTSLMRKSFKTFCRPMFTR